MFALAQCPPTRGPYQIRLTTLFNTSSTQSPHLQESGCTLNFLLYQPSQNSSLASLYEMPENPSLAPPPSSAQLTSQPALWGGPKAHTGSRVVPFASAATSWIFCLWALQLERMPTASSLSSLGPVMHHGKCTCLLFILSSPGPHLLLWTLFLM